MIDILVIVYIISVMVAVVDFVRYYRQNKEAGFNSVKEYLLTAFLIFTPVINTIVALTILS